ISGTIAMKCGIPDSAVFAEARFTESFWFFVRPGAMIGSMKTGSRSQASRIRDRSLPRDSVVLVFSATSQDSYALHLFLPTSQLQICHTPSFAVNDRAGMRRAPQHVLWGSAVCGQSGCRSRIT